MKDTKLYFYIELESKIDFVFLMSIISFLLSFKKCVCLILYMLFYLLNKSEPSLPCQHQSILLFIIF